MIRLFGFIITSVICIHLVACFWYFTAKIEGFHPDTWVVRYGFADYDNGSLYLISIYWAITTLTSVGYGDISAFT